MRSGARLLLATVLIALAGCANAGNSVSNAASVATPVASADGGSSVNRVSDVLGQRLDSMLNSGLAVRR